MDFDRHCAEIVAQAALLTGYIDGADLTVPVPSCPGWNVSQLVRHVEGGLRWAAEIVATRAGAATAGRGVARLVGYADEDPTLLATSLAESAAQLAAALRQTGAGRADVVPGRRRRRGVLCAPVRPRDRDPPRRRRAGAGDATSCIDADVAVDGIEEWLELGCLPFHFEVHPQMRELLGSGPHRRSARHRHRRRTGCSISPATTITWRRTAEAAAADIRAPVDRSAAC